MLNPNTDISLFTSWIARGSHVLDVGCGDGSVLEYLQQQKDCSGYGIEIDEASINQCILRRVNVIQHNVEEGLDQFADNSFDTVVCLYAMQMIKQVETMLYAFRRIAGQVIVAFPNFGYWRHRTTLLKGRMPVSKTLPYQWYDTPNIRCATMHDFAHLAATLGFKIEHQIARKGKKKIYRFANWRSDIALFNLKRH